MTGLDSGTLYDFQVRAVTASAKSNPSHTASATTLTSPVPLKPTGLTATAGDDSVTLRWQNPENVTITSYRYRMTSATSGGNPDFSSSAWTPMAGSSLTTTSYEVTGPTVDTGLTVDTVYYFEIQARSRQGDSEPSDTVSARPGPCRCGASGASRPRSTPTRWLAAVKTGLPSPLPPRSMSTAVPRPSCRPPSRVHLIQVSIPLSLTKTEVRLSLPTGWENRMLASLAPV